MGRIAAAWSALRGKAPTPPHVCHQELEHLRAEWREYELTLNSYMEKMNAWAARVAKREKRAAVKLLEAEGSEAQPAQASLPLDPKARKAALRQIYGGRLRGVPNAHGGPT